MIEPSERRFLDLFNNEKQNHEIMMWANRWYKKGFQDGRCACSHDMVLGGALPENKLTKDDKQYKTAFELGND